jgi:TrkA domain protein
LAAAVLERIARSGDSHGAPLQQPLEFVVDDLPGIGRIDQMTGITGGRITVVVHHSGRRAVYGLNAGADQASAVELSDQQARKLGAVLGGAFFKPAVVEEVEAVFDGRVGDTSYNRVTIIAIIRGDQAITAPEPSEILRAGDRLVYVSRRQDMGPFRDLVVG